MTINVASQQSLLVDSSGLMSKLSFTATREWPRSFIIFSLMFLDRPAANNFSNWDVGSLLMIDNGFKPWETSEIGDDKWAVDDLCQSETFFADELKTVIFNPVRPVDLISVDNGAKQSPLVPVSLSESRFMNGLLLVMAGVEGIGLIFIAVMAGAAGIGSTLIALLERGVTARENGFASLIDIGGWDLPMLLLLREGWKVFLPLAEAFSWMVWKCGQYCQPLFWRLVMNFFFNLFFLCSRKSAKDSEYGNNIPWLRLYQMHPPDMTQTLSYHHLW